MLEISIIAVVLLIVVIVVVMFNKKNNHPKTAETNTFTGETNKVEKPPVENVEPKRIDPRLRRSAVSRANNDITVRIHPKPTSAHGNFDPLNDEASTVLSNTCLADEDRERRHFEKMMVAFRKIFDNVQGEDIKNFCKLYKISSIKRSEHSTGTVVSVEIDEDQLCNDANFWLISYKNSEQHRVLPGTIIRTTFKTFNADNARSMGEVFRGIMLIVPGNKFEVVEPAIAEKRNGLLVITKTGRLGVPLGGGGKR